MAEECAAVEPLLSAWLDGELAAESSERVRAHLQGCAGCAAVADDLSVVSGLLGNLPVRRASGPVVAALHEPDHAPDPLRPAMRRVQALAVATGLLVGAAFALGGGEPAERQVPTPLDAFVADQFGPGFRSQTTVPVLLQPDR